MTLNPFDRIRRSYHGEAARLLKRLHELKSLPSLPGVGYSEEIHKIEIQLESLKGRKPPSGVAWKTVQLARRQDRPQPWTTSSTPFPILRNCTETG